jgi:alkanesulfonate monooxygenase SsuD/methylene tetrahydromethanopterin reductase-like flavin-dependent oxidoreductase (luciferase family)
VKVGIMLPLGETDDIGSWTRIRELAELAEAEGLDSLWVADHFFYKPPDAEPKGLHEAWTLLSAVAGVTRRVELAPLVLCSAFRNPGLVANMAATLDVVSEGRLILGVGAGWHDPEFEAFGYPPDHKVGRFEEWIEIVVRLLRGETVTFDGRYYQTRNAVVVPAPERRIPILIAGNKPRMMSLVARHANSWNTAWFGRPDDKLRERLRDLDTALDNEGRDRASLERQVGLLVRDPDQPSEEEDDTWFSGSVEELADLLREHERLGFAHAVVIAEPRTPQSVKRLAEAVRLSRE